MKNIFLFAILLFTSFHLSAQDDFEVRVSEVTPATMPRSVVVEMRGVSGQMPLSTDDVNDMIVTLKWDLSTGIDLGSTSGSYNMTKVGGESNSGGIEQQIIAASGTPFKFANTWVVNQWYPILTVPVINGDPGEIVAVVPDGGSTTEPRISFADENFVYFITDVPFVNGEALLPIKINSFTAVKFEENSGKLDWSSSSEINGSHFEIERSTDNSSWEKIGVVKAVGESTKRNDYEYVDRNVGALRSNTTFYYRLKMVDNDNSFEYSAVRSITFSAVGVAINVFPNPTTDRVSINMSTESSFIDEDATAIFRATDGKILLKNKISHNGITEIDMNDVPSGLILLQIEFNNKIYTEKIIKID